MSDTHNVFGQFFFTLSNIEKAFQNDIVTPK